MIFFYFYPLFALLFFLLIYKSENRQILNSSSLRRNTIMTLILIIATGVTAPYLFNKRLSGKDPLYLFSTTEVGAFKKYGIISDSFFSECFFR